jgi:hypothetical protein
VLLNGFSGVGGGNVSLTDVQVVNSSTGAGGCFCCNKHHSGVCVQQTPTEFALSSVFTCHCFYAGIGGNGGGIIVAVNSNTLVVFDLTIMLRDVVVSNCIQQFGEEGGGIAVQVSAAQEIVLAQVSLVNVKLVNNTANGVYSVGCARVRACVWACGCSCVCVFTAPSEFRKSGKVCSKALCRFRPWGVCEGGGVARGAHAACPSPHPLALRRRQHGGWRLHYIFCVQLGQQCL